MSNLYSFSVQKVLIAPWLGGGTYGASFTLASTKTLEFGQKMITDKTEGNSYITDLETQLISADVKLDTGGFEVGSLAVFTGIASATSGSDTVLPVNNKLLPYFGCIAQTYPNSGDILWFFPYCKITSDWSFKLEFGKIIVPQFKFEAIQDPTLGFIWQPYIRAVANGAITFPPTV